MSKELNKNKKIFIFVLILFVIVAVICVIKLVNKTDDTVLVGIAMPNDTKGRWTQDAKSIENRFTEKGYETIIAFANDDVYTQINQIEDMIKADVDILLITPIQADSLREVVKKAKDKNIPVIAYDRMITNTNLVDYYVTFKNYEVGKLQAQFIVEKLDLDNYDGSEPYHMEMFAGDMDDFNSRYYFKGAMAVLKKYLDDGKIVIPSGQQTFNQCAIANWSAKVASNRLRTMLEQYYTDTRPDAILCANDDLCLGLYDVLKEFGYEDDMPVLTGQDAVVDYVKLIKDNDNMMTVFKDTRILADVTATMIDNIINGIEPEINNTDDYNNGIKRINSYEVIPESVDSSNYYDILIDSGYISQDSI